MWETIRVTLAPPAPLDAVRAAPSPQLSVARAKWERGYWLAATPAPASAVGFGEWVGEGKESRPRDRMILVEGPPRVRLGAPMPTAAFGTESKMVRTIDFLIRGLERLGGLVLLVDEASEPEGLDIAGMVSLLPDGLPISSGMEGNKKVGGCREYLLTPVGTPATAAAGPVCGQAKWPNKGS